MKKLFKALFALSLLAALAAGLILLRKSQETRKGAFFATAKIWFLPSDASGRNVGELTPVFLVGDFGDKVMTGFNFKITYSKDIFEAPTFSDLNGDTFDDSIVFNPKFGTIISASYNQSEGAVYVAAVSTTTGVTGLQGINDPLIKFSLKIKAAGSGTVAIDKNYSHFEVVGETASADRRMEVKGQNNGDAIKVDYTFGGGSETFSEEAELKCISSHINLTLIGGGPTLGGNNGYWVTLTEEEINETIIVLYSNSSVNFSFDDEVTSIRNQPSLKLYGDGRNYTIKAYKAPYTIGMPNLSNPFWEKTLSVDCGLLPTSTLVPTPTISTGTPILNFKVSFVGVADSSKTTEVPVILLRIEKGYDKTAEFKGITLQPDQDGVFKGRIALTGVNPSEGYVISVKGSKHLSRRFCTDNQAEPCRGAGGIALVGGENNLDFSRLSLEPGDIVENEKDWVGANDFTKLKANLGEIDPEILLSADLDFNGVINGRDLVLILQTLSSKPGEMY